MGYIYKITNDINNKIYIGKTELPNPEDRWKEHLQDYKRDRCEKRPLYEAMNKYGIEHFHFEVIEETDNTCEREQYWIQELHTYIGFKDCNGYNATLGGDGKSYLNLKEDEVIKYHIEEACYFIGNTAEHFNVDKSTIKKILIRHDVKWLTSNLLSRFNTFMKHQGIYQVNIKTKETINIYENIKEAEASLNLGRGVIGNACRSNNINKHYKEGYFWCFGNEYYKYLNNICDCNYSIRQEYKKYSTQDFELIYRDLLKTKNLRETIRNLNLNINSDAYLGRELKKRYPDYLEIINSKNKIAKIDKMTNKIIKTYNSIREANIDLEKPIDSSNIRSCLAGKTKTAYGYIWEYIE